MEDNNIINEHALNCARGLVDEIENGNDVNAKQALDELVRLRDSNLYQELGKLTRELHDALNSFRLDARLTNIAEQEIPDARERLNYVISMTDKAANSTLTAVEESLPVCDSMGDQVNSLISDWDRFTNRQMDAKEFRDLSLRVGTFLSDTSSNTAVIKANLNNVLMAQDFQDLTGQIIKRVITLVEEVEGNLVNLVKISGLEPSDSSKSELSDEEKHKQAIKAEGPAVPGVDEADVLSGQDDVDDLLSSLGF